MHLRRLRQHAVEIEQAGLDLRRKAEHDREGIDRGFRAGLCGRALSLELAAAGELAERLALEPADRILRDPQAPTGLVERRRTRRR